MPAEDFIGKGIASDNIIAIFIFVYSFVQCFLFTVLYFEEYVIPDEISIFETFNPGAVIGIWSYTIAKNWICLWEDKEFYHTSRKAVNRISNQSRRFRPKLKRIQLPTK